MCGLLLAECGAYGVWLKDGPAELLEFAVGHRVVQLPRLQIEANYVVSGFRV